jgi:ABC-type transporter Mla maintaining outer membrane lipid asymmetry permease subunit MlaE
MVSPVVIAGQPGSAVACELEVMRVAEPGR